MPVETGFYNRITIWHLAYSRSAFEIKKRFINHMKKSNIHSPEFLKWWYNSHINGEYPKTKFNITELPIPVKDYFMIDDDYYYFRGRTNLEPKHFLDAYMWVNYFKPVKSIELGCGVGQRVFALFSYGVDAYGSDISEYAINNSQFKDILKDKLSVENILDINYDNDFDLVICYDILEHLDPKDLDKALDKIYLTGGKNFLFSIPFIGDPNLDNDSTHKIRMTKEQWIDKLKDHDFKIMEVPSNFLYRDQLIICKK
jgi:2-polyprenyl-3-methyl-5-hydroxy-6-metoxy-1,4-benzoquinol methylase